jgi:hypothetical protein
MSRTPRARAGTINKYMTRRKEILRGERIFDEVHFVHEGGFLQFIEGEGGWLVGFFQLSFSYIVYKIRIIIFSYLLVS